MAAKCKRCGVVIFGRVGNATTCWSCANSKSRIADPQKKRKGNFARLFIDGILHCVDCKAAIVSEYKRRAGAPMRCDKCRSVRNSRKAVQSFAHNVVGKAIRLGLLKKPSDFQCADCGKPAECYDHRDYSKPLDVQPVCCSCNVMRGPADACATREAA